MARIQVNTLRAIGPILLWLVAACSAFGQGSTGTASRIIWGPSLPATCSHVTGQVFFKNAAPNIGPYYCDGTDMWAIIGSGGGSGTVTVTGGTPTTGNCAEFSGATSITDSGAVCGGGATSSQQLTDLKPTKDSATQITVDAGQVGLGTASTAYAGTVITRTQLTITAATAANPMVVTVSAVPSSVQIGDSISIAGAAGTGCSGMNAAHIVTGTSGTTITFSYNNTGCTYTSSSATLGSNSSATGTPVAFYDGSAVILEHPSSAGLIFTCTGSCQPRQVTSPTVQIGGVPIFSVTLTGTSGGTFNVLTDTRRGLTNNGVQGGTGIDVTQAGTGLVTVAIDSAIVPDKTGANTFTGANDFSAASVEAPNSTTLPATCSVGMVYFDSDAPAGSNWYGCTALNTWTVQGGGGTYINLTLSSCNGNATTANANSFDYPSGGAFPECRFGYGGINFQGNSANLSGWTKFILPQTFTTIRLDARYSNKYANTNEVTFSITTSCDTALEAGQTFNSAQTITASGDNGGNETLRTFSISSLTLTGCSAGNELYIKLLNTSTAAVGNTYIYSLGLTIQ
jgi:hypothetical protein